jgi:catechol 2,3-dioxygenase-like lactoylglutathione lyase family enzyme
VAELDHVVIHVDDWASTVSFYTGLFGVDSLPSPEAEANPLDAVVFRLGNIQVNVHGPWPGLDQPCCPPPWTQVGGADLAFSTDDNLETTRQRIESVGATVTYGPVRAFGARGWGQSIYTRDPSGNGIEIIHYR